MDKIVSKIAALGVPGLILFMAIEATGFYGAAAMTTALAALDPGGMIGGIATLGVIGLISQGISQYGFDVIYTAVVKELYKRGETKESIVNKINKYPVSKTLKLQLKDTLEQLG